MHFYAQDWMLANCLLDYVSTGLEQGEACIVSATPQVLICLQKGLRALGVDVASALARGQYITYDAEELLAGIMNDGHIDIEAFRQEAGGMIKGTIPHTRIRIYCELAPLLLTQANFVALFELERQWDRLQQVSRFSLYCAYPAPPSLSVSARSTLKALAQGHSLVVRSHML